MENLTVKYKDEIIADLPNGGACILRTAEKYMEDDITVEYSPRYRSYELTFSSEVSQAGTPVFLVDLDEEVAAHINDLGMQVSMYRTSVPDRNYVIYMVFSGNAKLTYQYNVQFGASYGLSASTPHAARPVFRPANSTLTASVDGNGSSFANVNGKYYLIVQTGRILDGTYILTFYW